MTLKIKLFVYRTRKAFPRNILDFATEDIVSLWGLFGGSRYEMTVQVFSFNSSIRCKSKYLNSANWSDKWGDSRG